MSIFCQWPDGCENYKEGRTDYCGSHNTLMRKQEKMKKKNAEKPIYSLKKVSDKQASALTGYSKVKAEMLLEDTVCQCCFDCYAEELHHRKGRVGYADREAREKDIPLLVDKRFLMPVCHGCHVRITSNSKWALEQGYSLPRAEIKE